MSKGILFLCFVVLVSDLALGAVVDIKPVKLPGFVKGSKNACVGFAQNEDEYEILAQMRSLLRQWERALPDVKFGIYFIDPFPSEAEFYQGRRGVINWYKDGEYFGETSLQYGHGTLQWPTQAASDQLPTIETQNELENLIKTCSGELSTIILYSDENTGPSENLLLKIALEYESIFQTRQVLDKALIDKFAPGNHYVGAYD